MRRPRQLLLPLPCLAMLAGLLHGSPAWAQSLTSGSLRGIVTAQDGRFLAGVQVSLERLDGRAVQAVETGRDGSFGLTLVQPGTYRVLVEQVGFQPVRYLGVPVAAGQTTVVLSRLEPKPPPIDAVREVPFAGGLGGSSLGPVLRRAELTRLDPRVEATDLWRDITEVDGPRDGRPGLAVGAGGLPGTASQLYVDGLPETLIRHPGVPGEPTSAPLFPREALAQAQLIGAGFDTEWRGYPGPVLAGHTERGGNVVTIRPYGTLSTAGLGGAADDNPADSSATSFQVGASLSGAIVTDTAHFSLRFDLQSLRIPAAHPWAVDTATLNGAPVSLRETLPELGADLYGTPLASAVSPVVRAWRGFSGLGRFDWNIGGNQVLLRFGYARWTEEQPVLGPELSNQSGAELEANDISAALSVTSGGARLANELRIGFTSALRDWKDATLPPTALIAEGIAFGGSPAVPGKFDRQAVDVSDALQAGLGRHRLKLGFDLRVTSYQQDYRFGSAGAFAFGDLDHYADGEGVFFQTVDAGQTAAEPRISEVGGFLQDTWAASPEIQLLLGLRYDRQLLPDDKILSHAPWVEATGIPNDVVPEDGQGISPRIGLLWDVQNRGEWILTGGAGLYQGLVDPALFAEAILFDGSTDVRRGIGTFQSWPGLPDGITAPTVGPRLTMFNESFRKPRGLKAGVGVRRAWTNGLALRLEGNYYHTDFLLRRIDLNLVPEAVGQTQEGRPVFGQLVHQGGLLVAEPGSNRRFDEFDLVSGLASTGFSDHQEATAALERKLPYGISFSASYTFSHTEDNVLGLRALDPADGLNPFPEGQNGVDWAEGRSDFDVPHRFNAFGEYRTQGRTPIAVGARFRYRSGLPFTPGFRPGVDPNGDGAGNNDPAYLLGAISGLSELLSSASCDAPSVNAVVARNSCREDAVSALDARVEIGLPVRFSDGSRLALVVDGFNLISSETGIVDRALVLVDPAGTLTVGGGGQINVPLIANPNFGKLLSRRTDSRFFRIGLRVGY